MTYTCKYIIYMDVTSGLKTLNIKNKDRFDCGKDKYTNSKVV